jgi:hypothetical protein
MTDAQKTDDPRAEKHDPRDNSALLDEIITPVSCFI